MSDINSKSDGLMHDNDSENKIAALKEKLKNNHPGVRLNGSNGNGTHSSNKIDSKEQNLSKIANGVTSKVDNGIVIKRIEKHTNSHFDMKHTNGTSSVTPAETTLRNVENNIIEQTTTSTMVNKTGNWLIYGGYSHCDHFGKGGTPRIPMYIFAYDLLGMSYEEDEESIDDEEIDDSSQDR